MKPEEFFEHLWKHYVAMAPRAARLKTLFEERGETVVNDHVAFRTFDSEPIRLKEFEKHLIQIGYRRLEPYHFEQKHLDAWGYVHEKDGLPRIFLSALDCNALGETSQAIIRGICGQIDPARVASIDIFWAGTLWRPILWQEYTHLRNESEYAAWLAALGMGANHFTIAVNSLQKTTDVDQALQVVEDNSVPVNTFEGRVKGSPKLLLEQGSTLADRMEIEFAGGERHEIPTCYYEFAKRYPDQSGRLYEGFVAASANRIFESTDRGEDGAWEQDGAPVR